MNDDFSLNERYIKKIVVQFTAVLAIMVLAGFFLRGEVRDLLNAADEAISDDTLLENVNRLVRGVEVLE